MSNISFSGLLLVMVAAFVAPILLGLSPARRLPSVLYLRCLSYVKLSCSQIT